MGGPAGAVLPPAPDLSAVDPSLLAYAPDRLLALAADLLTWGDTARGGQYLDLLERAQPSIQPGSVLAARLAVAVGAQHYWYLPVSLLMKDQFRSDTRIGKVTAPVLAAAEAAVGL